VIAVASDHHPAAKGRSLSAESHHVRDLIWSRVLTDGDADVLGGTEESLAKDLGVSRNAVRRALASLANDGVLARRRGVGTSIVAEPVTREAAHMGMSDAIGDGPRRIRRVTASKEKIAANSLLQAQFGDQPAGFLRWERVTFVDDAPYSAWTSYLPLAWAEPLCASDEFDALDMFKIVARLAPQPPVEVHRRIQAVPSDERTALQLGITPGWPVIRVERRIGDAAGTCCEIGFAECRSDRFVLSYASRCY